MYDKIISLVIMIVLFYMAISSVLRFSNLDFDSLKDLITEYDLGLIDDLIVTNSSTCPKEYNNLFKDYMYPGNNRGCVCNSGKEIQMDVQKCPANCVYFESHPKQKMVIWKGKTFCVTRTKKSFKDYILTYNNSCSNGFKPCGKINTLNSVLCLENNKTCPISNLKFLTKNDLPLYSNNSNEKIFQINNQTFVLFNWNLSSYNSTILSFFSIAIENPCLYSERYNSKEYLFGLQKNVLNYGCVFDPQVNLKDTDISIDNRFRNVDQQNIQEFFDENRINDLIGKLGEVNSQFKNTYIYLKGRQFSGWKPECITGEFSISTFLETENFVSAMLFYNIIYSFILILILLVLSVSSCFFVEYFEPSFKLLSILYCLINLLYPIQIISKSNFVINSLSDEVDLCSDPTANFILKNVVDHCNDLQSSYLTILFVDIFYCAFIIYILYRWIKPYNQKLQDTYKRYIDRKPLN